MRNIIGICSQKIKMLNYKKEPEIQPEYFYPQNIRFGERDFIDLSLKKDETMEESEIRILVQNANEVLEKLNLQLHYNNCAQFSSYAAPKFWLTGEMYPKKESSNG